MIRLKVLPASSARPTSVCKPCADRISDPIDGFLADGMRRLSPSSETTAPH